MPRIPIKAKPITLTLTEWQQRVVADHLKLEVPIKKLTIRDFGRHHLASYRVPTLADFKAGTWHLYLSAAQSKKVGAALGGALEVSSLTISKTALKDRSIEFVR